mmetsp:Transcript_104280/g.301693  ORF Transcript_104280/g.301693 Transcript_104280/m.301693 type:complete len:132 (-) Transcript_104280:69-464(-)
MLVYFSQGRLPWQGIAASSSRGRYKMIGEAKRSTPPDVLCQQLPAEFTEYLAYCRGLAFEDRPDYDFLRGLLRKVFRREGYRNDFTFEWTLEALGVDLAARELADRNDLEHQAAAAVEEPAPQPTLVEVVG